MKQPKTYHPKPITCPNGFTLIELLVVVSILAILTTVVTVNFQRMRASDELNAARQDLISKIREVQGFAYTGRTIPGQTEAADAYIITLTANSQSYQINYELNSVSTPLETMNYSTGQRVTATVLTINSLPTSPITIRISAPYGTTTVNNQPNQIVDITLSHSSAGTKNVIIDGISGRVTAQ